MIRYFVIICLVLLGLKAFAQDKPVPMKPGRTMATAQPKQSPDSAEFVKVFKELYPFIKPEKSLKVQSDQYFLGISRSFKMQGIDSLEASKVAFKNLDAGAFEKMYFDVYRKNMSAKELRKYLEFVKTPEGQHILSVIPALQRAPADANMYIGRTINTNLGPMRQLAHEKMEKERPPIKPGQTPAQTKHGDVFDQKNAGSSDSLIRTRQLESKLPKSIDSLATPKPRQ
ncbi:MAG: DUF2059 domain-containing protein [Ignavibacteriota bacterium]